MSELGEIKYGKDIGLTNKNGSGFKKYIWSSCIKCGKQRWVALYKGAPRSSHCCHCNGLNGSANPWWKGGRCFDGHGYIIIRLQPKDFFYPMVAGRGYVYEHRLIMAKHLGRCLLDWEIVHHKNGIRDDNRIENLMLLPNSTHHAVDAVLKQRVKALQNKIKRQSEEIKRLKESTQLNP